MIYKKLIVHTLFVCILFSFSVMAQMHLSNFMSRSVRIGYPVATYIDSLLIDTKVNSGLATTRISMVVYPSGYCISMNGPETPVDSIEMSLSFTLPTDFVADSMWLWVDGKPQVAYIQDRTLAASQYNQIVGRRRDPALLQYNGNGRYWLRIFPTSSYVARKIAMQFHHTFDDDSTSIRGNQTCITTPLPVVYDTVRVPYYFRQGVLEKRPIKYTQLSCVSNDASSYSAAMAGLGSGTFSKTSPLVLSGSNIWDLQAGTITGKDPTGASSDYLWIGRDLKSTKLSAGFSTELSENGLTFMPEPATRIIVVDMRNTVWDWNDYYSRQAAATGSVYTPRPYYMTVNIWERAQKYAILAIQSYVNQEQSFNIILAGKKVRSVFNAPVQCTDENKRLAISAILGAKPDPAANTIEAVQAAIRQGSEGITILISDLYTPHDYFTRLNPREISEHGKAYDSTLQRIDSLYRSVPALTLFSISDNWKLYGTSLSSGGYAIGGLRNRFAIPYTYVVIDGRRVMNLELTPLFGSANPTGITRLKVRSRDLEDIVFSLEWLDLYQLYIMGRPPVQLPAYTPLLQVAGRTPIEKFKNRMTFVVSGKMGGLRFNKELTAATDYTPAISAFRPDEDVQWAFRKTEWLAADNIQANAPEIKRIGKEYHIVTRQTSLLALEPGMTLWPDTIGQPANPSAVIASNLSGAISINTIAATDSAFLSQTLGGAPNSSSTYGYGLNIDSISLKSIAGVGVIPLEDEPVLLNMTKPFVTGSGKKIMLQFPSFLRGMITIALYDLTGRRIAMHTIDASQYTDSRFVWDLARTNALPARGQYMLRISGKGYNRVYKMSLLGR